MPGTIRLQNIRVPGAHGVYPEERARWTTFSVDVDLEVADLDTAAETDELADTLDYGSVAEIVQAVVRGPSRNLLERLAGEILDRIGELGGVRAATVRVRKPQPITLAVLVEHVEVELTRSYGDGG